MTDNYLCKVSEGYLTVNFKDNGVVYVSYYDYQWILIRQIKNAAGLPRCAGLYFSVSGDENYEEDNSKLVQITCNQWLMYGVSC